MSLNKTAVYFVIGVMLCALTLAVFWPVTGYKFLNYDDDIMVWGNPAVKRGVTMDGLQWALTTFHGSNWNPLTWFSHMLDVQIFGLNAERHHLVNLLLHVTNVLLVFLVLGAMTGALWKSAFIAALFAVHPQRVESVAWIAERKDMLFVCFGLLTLAAYLFFARRPGRLRYLLVLLFFILGLSAKPMLMTLPLTLLLLDYWPLGRIRFAQAAAGSLGRPLQREGLRGLLVEKIPLFCLALASLVVSVIAQRDALVPLADYPLGSRIANMLTSGLSYLDKTVRPVNLAVLYPLQTSFSTLWTLGALLILILLLVLAVMHGRRRPALFTGWFFFLLTLAPVSGIAPLGFQAMADRFTYLPHLGLFIALAWFAGEIGAASRARTVVTTALCLAALGVLATLTGRQVGFWRDDEQLFRHALAVTKRNHVALSNLANALIEKGKLEEGIELSREALVLRPREAVAHNNLGIALAKLGRFEEARVRFESAVQFNPSYTPAMLNLGKIYQRQGRYPDAAAAYRNALRYLPKSPDIHNNLGMVFLNMNRLDEARQAFEDALRLDPAFLKARANLDLVLRRLGKVGWALPSPDPPAIQSRSNDYTRPSSVSC